MTRRVWAMAGVALVLSPALAVSAAYSAGAATVVNYRDYQQTLPYSVLSGIGLDEDQETKLTNNTRTGLVGGKTVAPLGKPTLGPRALFPALSGLFMISESIPNGIVEYDRDTDTKPDWIDQEEWDACALSGGDDWIGNFFDGARDWTASLNGTNCNEVRAGWAAEKNPAYQPIGESGGPGGYPVQTTHTGFSLTVTVMQPYWSNALTRTVSDDPTRKEGWVYPMSWSGTTSKNLSVRYEWINAAGVVRLTEDVALSTASNTGTGAGATGSCSVTWCVLGAWTQTNPAEKVDTDGSPLMGRISRIAIYGQGPTTLPPVPFVNPRTGSYTGELARQVILAWVKTESGNVYQCRTESFVETAPVIPRPCEPEVPPGEVITEKGWEVVPETDTGYVPGTNPTRGIQTITVPDVVRDWQRDNDEETLLLLDLELEGVGSCFDNPEECADWYTDPNKAAKYTCTYGGRVVSLAECTKYARIFKPGAITNGSAYPQPSNPNPSSGPSNGVQTSTTPGPATQPGDAPGNPNQPRNCFPTGWGLLNPIEWVYKPVRCVLEWAFVPRDSYVQSVIRGMQVKWTSSSLVQLLAVLEEGTQLVMGGTGCEGPTVTLDIYDAHYSGNPLSACAEPMAGMANFSFIFTGVLAWVIAVASISRSIAGVVAFKGIGGDNS